MKFNFLKIKSTSILQEFFKKNQYTAVIDELTDFDITTPFRRGTGV